MDIFPCYHISCPPPKEKKKKFIIRVQTTSTAASLSSYPSVNSTYFLVPQGFGYPTQPHTSRDCACITLPSHTLPTIVPASGGSSDGEAGKRSEAKGLLPRQHSWDCSLSNLCGQVPLSEFWPL